MDRFVILVYDRPQEPRVFTPGAWVPRVGDRVVMDGVRYFVIEVVWDFDLSEVRCTVREKEW